MAWQRKAWSGKARHGMPWFGKVRHGFSNETFGTASQGLARLGMAGQGAVRYGMARFYWKNHVVWFDMAGSGWVR